MSIPQIETERLCLRSFRHRDLQAHHEAIGSDPQVTWSGKTVTLEKSRQNIENRLKHWQIHGFGMWAVVTKDEGTLLGHAGLQQLEETEEVEIGYYFGQHAWGHGYATEAGEAALKYGFEELHLPCIVAVVRPENSASQHVLTKLGLRHKRDEPHYGFDVQVWEIDASTFAPRHSLYRVIR